MIERNSKGEYFIKKEMPLQYKMSPILVMGKNAIKYYDCETGNISKNLDDLILNKKTKQIKDYQLIEKKSGFVRGFSIQYDKENDLIIIIACILDTRNLTENKKTTWQEIFRTYVDKEKNFYFEDVSWLCISSNYCRQSNALKFKTERKYYKRTWSLSILDKINSPKINIIDAKEKLFDEKGNWSWDATDVLKPFSNMFGEIVNIAGNKMICLSSISMINEFMKYNPPLNTSFNKNSKRLNEFLQYKLEDINIPENLDNCKSNYGWQGRRYNAMYENVQKFAVVQKINDAKTPICVVRTFFKSPISNLIKEGGRIYISKHEIISSRTLDNGDFMYQKLLDSPSNWNFPIEEFDENITKGTYLEYFGNIISDIDYKDRGLAIWSFLKFPITEQLYKMELSDYMKKVFKLSVFNTPINIIERTFGNIDMNESNIYKKLGISKNQLYKINSLMVEYMPVCCIYKYVTGVTPIFALKKLSKGIFKDNETHQLSDLDDSTFDYFVEIIKELFNKYVKKNEKNEILENWEDIHDSNGIRDILDVYVQIMKTYNLNMLQKEKNTIFSLKEEYVTVLAKDYYGDTYSRLSSCLSIYKDFLIMVESINAKDHIKPYFKTKEELANMHDTLVELINQQKDAIAIASWNKRKPFWNKFIFCDEKYSIIIPDSPADLATEGISLHHCVKSYIGRVSNGETNILFIRDNTKITEPFFTIEIDNDSIVQQIHGFSNRNIETEPDLIPFVNKWIKEKKLKTQNFGKVR